MKCTYLLMFILSITMLSQTKCSKWKDTKLTHKKFDIRTIIHESVDIKGIPQLIETIEKSFENKNPIEVSNYKGLIQKDDILVVTKRFIMWFSLTSKKNGRVVRSGGGLLAGTWEIDVDDKKNAKLKREDKDSAYTQNLLLAGSEPGTKLFGADVFGGYQDNKVVWGIEYATDVKSGDKTGKEIFSLERGAYSPDEGIFIETKGVMGNSNVEEGIESETDTDPRKNFIGTTEYTLTYRIPANRMEFITEVELIVKENNFGPISNAFLVMYLPGYENTNMVYASNPELLPTHEDMKVDNVIVNKWFRNSAVKRTFFYDINFIKHEGKKYTAQTAPGNGRILCVGAPPQNIGFICGYPNNDYIPKDTYEEYVLELSDNQKLKTQGRFHTLTYKLLSTANKTLTLKKGEKLLMIMRYKLINASQPMPDAEDPKKEVKVRK